MKKILIFIPILLLHFSVIADNVRTKVKPMKRVEIARIDTNGLLDTFFAYPDKYLEQILNDELRQSC